MDENGATVPFAVDGRAHNARTAVRRFLQREFEPSTGHLAALLNGCVFAPSLLTFWFVNGVVDFSTAIVVGAVGGPGGLAVRVLAYFLLVPVFLLTRMGYYLIHPTHRETVLGGACPDARVLSLDWFSVGILATGLPLALQDIGPWLLSNAVFLIGVFLLPRLFARGNSDRQVGLKLGAVFLAAALFIYAKYGGHLPGIPSPVVMLGPAATASLDETTTRTLLRITNSLLLGPVVVGAVSVVLSRILTRPELVDLPVVRRTLPTRDPVSTVLVSAGLGTVFYLLVVAFTTGRLLLVP